VEDGHAAHLCVLTVVSKFGCVCSMDIYEYGTYDICVFANTVRVRMIVPHRSSGGGDESDGSHRGTDGDIM
jgi:hypothetical protein